METDWNILGPEGIKFFGKISSTTTHELNNSIGVINEKAGLLEDLALMSDQGSEPDFEKWIGIVQKIKESVLKTHEIINNFNQFAHTADHLKKVSDPVIMVKLALSLSRRILSRKGIAPGLSIKGESVSVDINPFLFINLMVTCLVFAADHADENARIAIELEQKGKKINIRFSGMDLENSRAFPGRPEQALLDCLDCELKIEKEKNYLVILLDTSKLDGEKI